MKCDAAEFAKMYENIYIDLYKFALCTMRQPQEAEDAVSEAVLAGYEKIGQLKEPGAFKGWMFTILSNICKKKLKNRGAEVPLVEENDEDERINLPQSEAAPDSDCGLSVDLSKALGILSEEERDIVLWSVFSGYNGNEIAKILNQPPGTIRSKRSRAFAKMREYFEE